MGKDAHCIFCFVYGQSISNGTRYVVPGAFRNLEERYSQTQTPSPRFLIANYIFLILKYSILHLSLYMVTGDRISCAGRETLKMLLRCPCIESAISNSMIRTYLVDDGVTDVVLPSSEYS